MQARDITVLMTATSGPNGEEEKKTTMSNSLATGLLWLFVIFLGITFGAGTYEGRIVVSR